VARDGSHPAGQRRGERFTAVEPCGDESGGQRVRQPHPDIAAEQRACCGIEGGQQDAAVVADDRLSGGHWRHDKEDEVPEHLGSEYRKEHAGDRSHAAAEGRPEGGRPRGHQQ